MSREGRDGGVCGALSPICSAATPIEVEGATRFFPKSLWESGPWSGSMRAQPGSGGQFSLRWTSSRLVLLASHSQLFWVLVEVAGGGVLTTLGWLPKPEFSHTDSGVWVKATLSPRKFHICRGPKIFRSGLWQVLTSGPCALPSTS